MKNQTCMRAFIEVNDLVNITITGEHGKKYDVIVRIAGERKRTIRFNNRKAAFDEAVNIKRMERLNEKRHIK